MRIPAENLPARPVRRLTGTLVTGYSWFFFALAFLFPLILEGGTEFLGGAIFLLTPGILLIAIALRVTEKRGLPVTGWSLGAGIGGLIGGAVSLGLASYADKLAQQSEDTPASAFFFLWALVAILLIVSCTIAGAGIGRRFDERRSR